MTTGQKISSQLDELDTVKSDFIDALEAKGITGLNPWDKYETLVSKISDIEVKIPGFYRVSSVEEMEEIDAQENDICAIYTSSEISLESNKTYVTDNIILPEVLNTTQNSVYGSERYEYSDPLTIVFISGGGASISGWHYANGAKDDEFTYTRTATNTFTSDKTRKYTFPNDINLQVNNVALNNCFKTEIQTFDSVYIYTNNNWVKLSEVEISGILEDKTIDSGSVSKGDFVTAGTSTLSNRLNSATAYRFDSATISNAANLIDNDDNTYCRITGSTSSASPRLYIRLNINNTDIPSNAELVSVKMYYKIKKYAPYTSGFSGVMYIQSLLYGNSQNLSNTISTYALDESRYRVAIEQPDLYEGYIMLYENTLYSIKGVNTNNIGCWIQNNSASTTVYFDVYYVKFDITYKDNDKIHIITVDGEPIIGIANENGTSGDEIQVYVPDMQYEAEQGGGS